MQDILINKLHQYLKENNPEVLLQLEEKSNATKFLRDKVNGIKGLLEELQTENKPAYIIEEACMEVLTKELKPSKYNYICSILEEDFEFAFYQLKQIGTLLYEVVNMISHCEPVFEAIGFSEENEDNHQLRYAVTGIISEYLSK
jgi:Domain of unknown function (DUF1896)